MQQSYQNNTLKKYLFIFAGLLLLCILLGFVPLLFKGTIVDKHGLMPGSETRERYTKTTFPIEFKVYLFNITNKNEVIDGSKPKLQEVGPYVFEEWKEKFDMIDNEENDTLTYNMKSTFIFRPDLSNGLNGNEVITTVHGLIMGIALAVNVNRKPMLSLASQAINSIFHQPKEPFWSGRAMDYLFDGIEIDCTSKDFAAKAVCSIFGSGQVKSIEPLREDFYKFSIFGAMNGSGVGTYKVARGSNNLHDIGRIISFKGKNDMAVWGGDECDGYKGTDSTIFPSRLQKEEILWAYEPSICLAIGARYERESNYQGIPMFRFGFDFDDAKENEKLQCFCFDPPDDCPRRGTLNLFECVGAPIVVSLPHFYNADPSLLKQIQSGIIPNATEHAFYIDYESMSGVSLYAAKRLQFNLDVEPIEEVECMKNLPEAVMPLFWVEEGASLNEAYVNTLKYQFQIFFLSLTIYFILPFSIFMILRMVKVIQWIAIITGAAGTIFLAYTYFQIRNNTTGVSNEKVMDDKAANADPKAFIQIDQRKGTK